MADVTDNKTPVSTPPASNPQVPPAAKNVRTHTLPLLLLALLVTVITGTLYMVTPISNRVGGVLPSKPTLFPDATDTPTPTPITSAVTTKNAVTAYLNQRLGFTINYPSTWRFREYTRDYFYINNADGVAFNPISDKNPPDDKYALVSIDVEKNSNNLSSDEYLSKYIFCNEASAASNNCPVKNYDPINIGGVKGSIATISASTRTLLAVVANNGNMYSFRMPLNDMYKNLYSMAQKDAYFHQMLDSLQFLGVPTPTPQDTGIVGKITVKICNPEDQYGPPGTTPAPCIVPFKATVVVKSEDGSQELARATSNDQGVFAVNIPVGNYIVQPLPNAGPTGTTSGVSLPVGSGLQKVSVQNHKLTPIFLQYSGTY